MTRDQYLNQLRGTCKDGSSPNPAMLHDFYTRVARLEWAVEERIHMRVSIMPTNLLPGQGHKGVLSSIEIHGRQ